MVNAMIVCFVQVLNSGLQNEVRRRAVDEDAVGGPDEKPAHLEQAVQHVQAQVGEDLGEQTQPSMGSRISNAGSFLRMRQGLMMLSIDAIRKKNRAAAAFERLKGMSARAWGRRVVASSRSGTYVADDCRCIAIAYYIVVA